MKKIPLKERRISENTKVNFTIATFVSVIIFIIIVSATGMAKISNIDNNILENKNNILELKEYKKTDEIMEKEQNLIIIEIRTNTKWIIDTLIEIKEDLK